MARKDISMTDAELADFIDARRTLIVSTVGRDGHPHVAPMWYVVDDGRIVFRSFTKSQKIVNLRRDPRLTLLLESGAGYAELRGAMIKATARLNDDPQRVLAVYSGLAARYPMVGDEPRVLNDAAVEAAFGRYAAKNTVVEIDPVHVVTWDHTKLGGAY
jgi:PPOX class probable F420-dependent enzyme